MLLPIALIIFGSNATPMTVTTVRKIPSELPHAHLYLEDVEEICKILLDAFSRPSTSQPTILFSIGDDLQMDSIDDLERRGGSAKDFSIEVGGYSYDRIRLQSFGNPDADFYSLSDSGRWAMHSKLKAVFDARRFVIKCHLGPSRMAQIFADSSGNMGCFAFARLPARALVHIGVHRFPWADRFCHFSPQPRVIRARSRSLQTDF